MRFTLWFDDVCELPAREVLDRVRAAEKKPLSDLLVYDLLRDGDRPLLWGVYFFFSQAGECLYVGKNSARKFVERIPVHLCLYEKDWMNHLVKRIQKREGLGCLTDAAEAARSHHLLLMPVGRKEQTQQLSTVEKFFRLFAEPKYNALTRRKRHSRLSLDAPLIEVLQQITPRKMGAEPEVARQYCPICLAAVEPNPRYPRYICEECAGKASSSNGRRLVFSNVDISGGFIAKYVDTGESYLLHECFIGGVKCHANEARFGGIVIETVE